jgi:hypothetical protein
MRPFLVQVIIIKERADFFSHYLGGGERNSVGKSKPVFIKKKTELLAPFIPGIIFPLFWLSFRPAFPSGI